MDIDHPIFVVWHGANAEAVIAQHTTSLGSWWLNPQDAFDALVVALLPEWLLC